MKKAKSSMAQKGRFKIVFDKLHQAQKEMKLSKSEATATEMKEIDELREFATSIAEPPPVSFTTT